MSYLGAFSWVGSLIFRQVKDGTRTVIRDEINKKHNEILAAATVLPHVQSLPEDQRRQAATDITELAKNVGVAAAEAAIDSRTQIPGT